jgi:hypothetical protein
MYNRYIPQQDGSFRRNRMQDSCRPPAPRPAPPKPEPPMCPPPPPEPHSPKEYRHCQSGEGAGSFLRRLLPKDFDTGDLLIVLLLLLMAGDCPEDQNTALLTLAIYLFS